MKTFGLTGGIGSGKSYVANFFRQRGVPVYDTDSEAKRLMVEDPEIRAGLTSLLGEEAYEGDTLNRPFVAAYLFKDPKHAERINGIVHPRVKEDFRRWAQEQERQGTTLVGLESAILFEAGFEDVVDVTIMVFADMQTRISRAMQRDGATEEQIERRIKAQMNEDKKRLLCHATIQNVSNSDVSAQVDHIIEWLKKEDKKEQ